MLQIRDERVNRLAEKLACINRSTKTDAVRIALENELARIEEAQSLAERIQPILDRIAKRPRTGLEADRAFYDELSDDI
jgi:antitoxin VapB